MNGIKIHKMRVKLSTIIKADNSVEKQCQLCRRIVSHWKKGELVQPVIILDMPAPKDDVKCAGAILGLLHLSAGVHC
jgi:hypothetical protein